jgi:dTDP-4-dehydrorhamnose reductase
MDILILGGSGQLGQTVKNELKDDFKLVCLSKSELSRDKVKEKFILCNANYKENLKLEINRIYQSL